MKIALIAEGIDTVSEIYINGILIGTTNNQFRRYSFDISDIVEKGTNTIEISFTSAEIYASKKVICFSNFNINYQMTEYPYFVTDGTVPPEYSGEPWRNFIRKEQCSFAWDWGPCFIPAGVWMPIG
jgi:beta-mannosidase